MRVMKRRARRVELTVRDSLIEVARFVIIDVSCVRVVKVIDGYQRKETKEEEEGILATKIFVVALRTQLKK